MPRIKKENRSGEIFRTDQIEPQLSQLKNFRLKRESKLRLFSREYHGLAPVSPQCGAGLSWTGAGSNIIPDIRSRIGRGDLETALELLIIFCEAAQHVTPYNIAGNRKKQKKSYIPPKEVIKIINGEFLPKMFENNESELSKWKNEFQMILDHPQRMLKEAERRKQTDYYGQDADDENEFDFN